MAEVLFYHLERARLSHVLPGLLEKTLQRGWRAVVRTGAEEQLKNLDSLLWTYSDDSFLPHAGAGEGADHPIWLTAGGDMPNTPDLLFLVEGATAAVDELTGLTRCITIFDGADETALTRARDFWKLIKPTDHDATYWRQSPDGRWEKQA